MKPFLPILLLGPLAALHAADSIRVENLGTNPSIVRGPVNGVRLQAKGKTLAVYGDPRENPPGETLTREGIPIWGGIREA